MSRFDELKIEGVGTLVVDNEADRPLRARKWGRLFEIAKTDGGICVVVDSRMADAISTAAKHYGGLKAMRRTLPAWEASLDKFEAMEKPTRVWIEPASDDEDSEK